MTDKMSRSSSGDESWTLVDKDGYELENSACQTENLSPPEENNAEVTECKEEKTLDSAEKCPDSNLAVTVAFPQEIELKTLCRHDSTDSQISIASISEESVADVTLVNQENCSPGCSYPFEFTVGKKLDSQHESFDDGDSDLSIIDGDKQLQPPISDLEGNPDLQLLLAQFKAKFCQPSESAQNAILPSDASLVTFSEDLPVNFVQMCSNRVRNYIHTYNSPLNWKLTLLVALATACCLGLGIGHFVGQTSSWLIRRAKNRSEELSQSKVLLNNLKSCEANLGDLSRKHLASIDELKKELTTCRFKNGHGIIDESYCRRDDIVATKQEVSCQTEVSALKNSVENKQNQVAQLKQQVENLAAELVYYSQAHRESVGKITQVQTSEKSLDRRLQKFFTTLDLLFQRNDIAPLVDESVDTTLSSETKLLHLEAQILHMVAQFERQINQLQGEVIEVKAEKFSGWLAKEGIPEVGTTVDDIIAQANRPNPKSVHPFDQVRTYLLEMTDKLKAQFSAYSWLLTNLTGEKPFGDPIPSVSETKFSEKLVSYMEELRHSIMEKMSSLNTEEQRKKVTDHMEEIGSQAQSIVEPMMDLAQKGARNIGDMVKAVWNVNNEKLADVQRKHKKIFERFKESISDRVKDSWQWEKLKGDWMGLFNSVFWSASSGTAAVDDFDFPDKPETPVTDGEIKPANDFCPKSQKIISKPLPLQTENVDNKDESWLFSRAHDREKLRESERSSERKSDWLYKRSKGRKEQRQEDERRFGETSKAGWIFKRGKGRDIYRRGKG